LPVLLKKKCAGFSCTVPCTAGVFNQQAAATFATRSIYYKNYSKNLEANYATYYNFTGATRVPAYSNGCDAFGTKTSRTTLAY